MTPVLPLAIVLCLGDDDRAVVGRFADELGSRGWRVSNRPDPSADLIALSGPSSPHVREAAAGRTPVILPITVPDLVPWAEAFGVRSRLYRPRPGSLWRWWGPERMAEELIRATPDDPTTHVVVGYNWTLVEVAGGSGLAATPRKGAGGARTTTDTGRYAGRPLSRLAALARSFNPYERAIGCAAINAALSRHDLEGEAGDGLEPMNGETANADEAGTHRTVVVGRFPRLEEKLPGATVLELDPGPHDLPAEAAAFVVPGAERLIVSATAWTNNTLPTLMRLGEGSEITLVGPGTPLSPQLHAYGIRRLAGFVATDPEALRRAVAEGAGVRQFRQHGRQVIVRR